ncbi:MAG TPA: flavodoxin [Chryseosolibacter sp.]|nr:flavodoxin [Chryseosolibacter sp.]
MKNSQNIKTIGLFFGSDTGYTESVAREIVRIIGEEHVNCHDISKSSADLFSGYDFMIIGLSTWHDGQLQSDWDKFFEEFKTIDFTGKTVAFFGLGDQVGYSEYFVDGIGILAEVVYSNGGEIVGVWPTEGYNFESSKAVFEEGWFVGLIIDEDNQSNLTISRIDQWTEQILQEFNIDALANKASR